MEVRGDEISFTKMGRVHKLLVFVLKLLVFCKRDLFAPDFNGYIALLYISSDYGVQTEDGLTRRGRNM